MEVPTESTRATAAAGAARSPILKGTGEVDFERLDAIIRKEV